MTMWHSPRRRAGVPLVVALALAASLTAAVAPSAGAQAPSTADRYSLVHGCWAAASGGRFIAKTGSGYAATAADAGAAEPFRLQATDLGSYLFYGRARDFLAAGPGTSVVAAAEPSTDADWVVQESAGGAFTLTSRSGRNLAVAGDGSLTTAGGSTPLTLTAAQGCPEYPEAEVNVTGEPQKGATPYSQTRGYIDAHMHMMAFEFLGGDLHCGRPWHPYGIVYALPDCSKANPANNLGSTAAEGVLAGGLPPGSDPVGWPTFRDWPRYNALTHEQSYYKWLERSWRGGQRLFVNLFVENHALCTAYPVKRNSCNEMDSVRLQAKDIYVMQNYIDAQFGGPGKGWFRIVKTPQQARRVINDGKMAIVLGIEVSNLFDCGLSNGVPTPNCTEANVDSQLDAVYKLGVRDMEMINKFDNGFAGVAGDSGSTGVVVNSGNRLETGQFWQLETCKGPAEQSDREQLTIPGLARDSVIGNGLQALVPMGTLPNYPAPPHCNVRGLTHIGEYLVREMMKKGMIVDPDHLSVRARQQVLSILEASNYPGVVSSHSWSTVDAYPRIYKLGGVVTPYAGNSKTFVQMWRTLRTEQDPRYYSGFGYGADMNGFGAQGGPRKGPNPVIYPFKGLDPGVTIQRNRTGSRTWDINTDGVAHYGLYPDWIQDLRMQGGDQIVEDMARGSEAYLEMWERAEGVAPDRCRGGINRFSARGVGLLRIGDGPEPLLARAGQPTSRIGRTWSYCVTGAPRRSAGVMRAVYTPQENVAFISSTSARQRALGVGPGSRLPAKLLKRTKRVSSTIRTFRVNKARRFVFGIRKGRIRWIAVASPSASRNAKVLRSYMKLAGLR